jgi:superfamily I DNA and/or RNA helicase
VNVVEADMIAATVLRIYEREKENFKAEETVGVIVPYRNQITTIRNKIDESGIAALHGITIDTVERYQGSQRRYIIYGFTVQRHAQLKFLTDNVFRDTDGTIVDRKLNVAMTRAMEHLVMVGNAELLSHAIVFARLLHYVRSIQGYYEIPPQKYIKGMF